MTSSAGEGLYCSGTICPGRHGKGPLPLITLCQYCTEGTAVKVAAGDEEAVQPWHGTQAAMQGSCRLSPASSRGPRRPGHAGRKAEDAAG